MPVVNGLFLAGIPLIIFIFTVSIVMRGYFWDVNILKLEKNCVVYTKCATSIFDYLKISTMTINQTKAGRIGVVFLVTGLVLIALSAEILIGKERFELGNKGEAYDGNTWKSSSWRKGSFMFFSIILVCLTSILILFTFSNVYGNAVWTYLITFKIIMMVIEMYFFDKYLEEKLLVCPLVSFMAMCQNLVTYGANDFLVFLEAYIICLGITIIERTYFVTVSGLLTAFLEKNYQKIKTLLITFIEKKEEVNDEENVFLDEKKKDEKLLKYEEKVTFQNESPYRNIKNDSPIKNKDELNQNMATQETNQNKVIESNNLLVIESQKNGVFESGNLNNTTIENPIITEKKIESDSDIVLTSDIQEDLEESGEDTVKSSKSSSDKEKNNKSSIFTNEEDDESDEDFLEDHIKKIVMGREIYKKEIKKAAQESSDPNSTIFKMKVEEQNKKKKSQAEIYEECLGNFTGLSCDAQALFFFPIFLTVVWAFYDDVNLMEYYNIQKEGYIYYFLFAVIMIPFQILIDICFYNLLEFYHNINFYDYLSYLQNRFNNRKNIWKRDDDDMDRKISKNLRSLDQICLSSQFYFGETINMAGISFCVLGIQAITSNKYNFFADFYVWIIVCFWLVIIFKFYKITIWVGKKLKIWHVKQEESEENRQKSKENIQKKSSVFGKKLRLSIVPYNESFKSNKSIEIHETSKKTKRLDNFSKVYEIKENEERLKELSIDLQKNKFNSDDFRRKFLQINKKWMTDHISSIFSPHTLKFKRKNILKSFSDIYGEMDHNNHANSNESIEILNENNLNIKSDFDIINKLKTGKIIQIARYWYFRAMRSRIIKSQIAGLMEELLNTNCEFCGINWGLRCESIENIETIFEGFFKENRWSFRDGMHWDIEKWQSYFKMHASLRTICFNCSNQIYQRKVQVLPNKINENLAILSENDKYSSLEKKKLINLIGPLQNEIEEEEKIKENKEKKNRERIFSNEEKKENVKKILEWWRFLARLNMS